MKLDLTLGNDVLCEILPQWHGHYTCSYQSDIAQRQRGEKIGKHQMCFVSVQQAEANQSQNKQTRTEKRILLLFSKVVMINQCSTEESLDINSLT